ncbi:MacB-like protein [Mucilaginibacter frigoritolerans]|uniref:MacB-like protein n=1 Tax=Mucilaginibacter frigoritolerans TaxID=652788 RepID=A0A562TZ27_9SPHI|nr:ABC transporter permease [Mucilaginibacter frigoritolerans]TWI98817.1 MacB-like protein [Mucilaginibacter frigoritolerans]
MIKNYLKIAWRNLIKNRASSFINIGGLAVGMSVAMLIGLWIWDELSFNKYHQNYDNIAQVMQNLTSNGTASTYKVIPLPLGAELHKNYHNDFKAIVMSSWSASHTLSVGEKKITSSGSFMEADAPSMFTLKMIKGTGTGLADPSSVLLSNSLSKKLFGDADPINKIIKLDGKNGLKVIGVYSDLPENTTLHQREIYFIGSWEYYTTNILSKSNLTDWGENDAQLFVQLAEHANMARISEKIRNIKLNHIDKSDLKYKPQLFLQPMNKWHLYAQFKNGINTGGKIQYVWLFGMIGLFVLLLACINFMNLSTARSEKRAKEVGIRKAIGSGRRQLIKQFYGESLMVAVFAFVIALFAVKLTLPFFNEIANKSIVILWTNPAFWIIGISFSLFTGVIAGSYPALYLSSFQPVKVLKGSFKAGRFAALPRKVLVVLQFSVSAVLIIGTIIVFKQIQFAKNRPVGYSRDGLVNIEMTTNDLHKQFKAMRANMLNAGVVTEVAESSDPVTDHSDNMRGLKWKGKDPDMSDDFAMVGVSPEYGKTVGWQFNDGRDFSSAYLTDSSGIILNEAAVQYMGLKNPVGEIVKIWNNKDYRVIGVVKNIVMDSPYDPAKQTIYYISKDAGNFLMLRINPKVSAHNALTKIEAICKTYSPSVPFAYHFADDEYTKKFADEEYIGKLASIFASLAIFISCIGLFGMASFMAEQRTKEIGVRKVLGATVLGLWTLLSADFVKLVIISLLIAIPTAWYFMHSWLQTYNFHVELSWWVFAATAFGAIIITLLTVSYQSIKAALTNPINSLKTE